MSDLLESQGIDHDYNVSKHIFRSRYGQINIYQLEKPQNIVGSSYTFAGMDEFDVGGWRNCHVAFTKTIGRMRGCANPEIYFVTSPEGLHYTHKIFVLDNEDGERKLFKAKTTENIHLPDGYVDSMERNYDPQLLKAYRDGEFISLTSGQVYHAFSDDNVKPISLDPHLPLAVMCDFNRGEKPMSWNIGQVQGENAVIKWALQKKGANTRMMCEYLHHHLTENFEKIPALDFYGDYSGNTGTSNSDRTDWEIIIDYFDNLTRVSKYVRPCRSVRGQVNQTNARLKNGVGESFVFIDPEARFLIRDLELVTWDKSGMQEDQGNPERSHSSAALRYFINEEWPLTEGIRRLT